MSNGAGPNKWNSTPRKVFDAMVERVNLRMDRNKARHNQDIRYLEQRVAALEEQAAGMRKMWTDKYIEETPDID